MRTAAVADEWPALPRYEAMAVPADNAMTAFAHVVNDASNRLVNTVGRPLLFSGLTVAALILLMRATTPCDCDVEPAPATKAEAE